MGTTLQSKQPTPPAVAEIVPLVGTKRRANEVLARVLVTFEAAQRLAQPQVPQPVRVVLGARQHARPRAVNIHRRNLHELDERSRGSKQQNKQVRHPYSRTIKHTNDQGRPAMRRRCTRASPSGRCTYLTQMAAEGLGAAPRRHVPALDCRILTAREYHVAVRLERNGSHR